MSKVPTLPSASESGPRTEDSVALGTGIEWIIDAFDCDVGRLCDPSVIRDVCDQVIADLKLNVVGDPQVHQFDDPGGVTALYMLSESHLACHTYPEYRLATFNLYCCRARPSWNWPTQLQNRLGAAEVEVKQVARGLHSRESAISLTDRVGVAGMEDNR